MLALVTAAGLIVKACIEFKQIGVIGLMVGTPGNAFTETATWAQAPGVMQPPSART